MKLSKLIILTLILWSTSKVEAVKFNYRCNDVLYSVDRTFWGDEIQNCKNYRFYTRTVNFKSIPKSERLIINEIIYNLIKRGGSNFYDKLSFENVIISDNPDSCNNLKYTLRYIFQVDSLFRHRFSISFDKKGQIVGEHKFPDFIDNPNILNYISYCEALSTALLNSEFKKAYDNPGHYTVKIDPETGEELETYGYLSDTDIEYNPKTNKWYWKFKSDPNYDGDMGDRKSVYGNWHGKIIRIDAHENSVFSIENFSEFMHVSYD